MYFLSATGLRSRLMVISILKHICLHGKDLFIDLWIDVSPSWNEMYLKQDPDLKEKKNTKQNKSWLQDEAYLGIKTESPKANYDTSMHMFERPKNLLIICLQPPPPHPTPLASPLRRIVFTQRLVSGHVCDVNIASWSPFLSIRKSKYQRDIASKIT